MRSPDETATPVSGANTVQHIALEDQCVIMP